MKLARPLLLAAAVLLLARTEAAAHMKLTYPPDRVTTNGQGDPQKGPGPCADGPGSNMRTVLKAGQEVMIQWTETVSHAGHFRISFDPTGMDNFRDPATVTDIADPPTLPILADGLFKNGHAGGRKLMFPVRMPNMACKTCSIQVLQIMTDNQDVIYRHCADIELQMDGAPAGAPDGGSRPDAAAARDGGRAPDAPPPGGGGGAGGAGGAGGSGGSAPPPGVPPTPAPTGSGGSIGGSGGGGAGGSGGSAGSGGGGGGQPPPKGPGFFQFGCSVGGGGSGAPAVALVAMFALLLGIRRKRTNQRK